MDNSEIISTSPKVVADEVSETFRANLLQIMREQKIPAAVLSRKAGLNVRAVKDIEERRVMSPRIVTVFKLAEALGASPQEMLGLKKCHCADDDNFSAAVGFWSSLSADQQELLIAVIRQKVDMVQK